jgi:dolichol-phosphate mannosyltransferase
MISIVSPVYRAEGILDKLVAEIISTMTELNQPFEIILVDDRSPDQGWNTMQQLAAKDTRIKCVRLSRNFGQHPAIIAGLSVAQGEYVVVMDCDLQDQPKEIKKLLAKAHEGFDVVLAQRFNRQDGFFKKLSSKLFSAVYSYLTDTKFDNSVANFGVYARPVIKQVLAMNDYIKSFPLFIQWVGFNKAYVEVEHAERDSGKSSYTWSKLVSLAFNTIISFSNKPLKLFVKAGLIISSLSFLLGIITIYRYLTGAITVLGYSSLIVSIWFLSGVLMTIIGVVGIYIGKIFDQSKNRPPFIIDQIIN